VRRGSSCDVSARFLATYAGGYVIWLFYGLGIGSMPLILVDAAGLVCGVVMLTITLRNAWLAAQSSQPEELSGDSIRPVLSRRA
jgi:uncharacterized protein with PQ loop repeat